MAIVGSFPGAKFCAALQAVLALVSVNTESALRCRINANYVLSLDPFVQHLVPDDLISRIKCVIFIFEHVFFMYKMYFYREPHGRLENYGSATIRCTFCTNSLLYVPLIQKIM